MAKAKPNSKHSRAARRAASPSLDVDKSLTSLPRAESTVLQRDSILTDRANSGVQKKQSKPKPKTRAQRQRQQKGMDRAEAVMDQLEYKVAKSVSRGKAVNARRAEWEDTNRKASKSMFDALQEDEGDDADDADDAMVDDSVARGSSKPASQPTFAAQNQVVDEPAGNDEDEEIT